MSQPQQVTIPQAFQLAVQHHQAGRLQEAEGIYRQILGVQPNHADALHLLGTLALQAGRADVGLELIERAIAVKPDDPVYHCNRGEALNRLKRFDDAAAACQRAIALRPNFPEALNNLGTALENKGNLDAAIECFRRSLFNQPDFVVPHYNLSAALHKQGRLDEAIETLQRAVALQPGSADALGNLGKLLLDAGRSGEAISAFRQVVAMNPRPAESHFNLGNALYAAQQPQKAIESFRAAIAIRPDFQDAYLNLGVTLQEQQRHHEAVEVYRKAIAVNPRFGDAYNNLGGRLSLLGQYDEAIAALQRAREIMPNSIEVHSNLGLALEGAGRLDEAIDAHHTALAIGPQDPTTHLNFSLSLLLKGKLQQAWPEYEWRLKVKSLANSQLDLPMPRWNGLDLHGRRIVLHAEQGFGDSIQFARYIPMVAARGGHVIVACQRELSRLMQDVSGVKEVILIGQPLPRFDTHCPLPSLPHAFGTTLATIPAEVPYLRANPELEDQWRSRLRQSTAPDEQNRLNIGLVWAGSPHHQNDLNRSVRLSAFEPILRLKQRARFVSLQKGPPAAEAQAPPAGTELLDLSAQMTDFADTAAIVSQLDLVIAVDTAVVHLAGAMGKPVWVLIPANPDWRWMRDRDDSPWYPTMRLFRQTTFGSWTEPIEQIARQLDAHLSASKHAT